MYNIEYYINEFKHSLRRNESRLLDYIANKSQEIKDNIVSTFDFILMIESNRQNGAIVLSNNFILLADIHLYNKSDYTILFEKCNYIFYEWLKYTYKDVKIKDIVNGYRYGIRLFNNDILTKEFENNGFVYKQEIKKEELNDLPLNISYYGNYLNHFSAITHIENGFVLLSILNGKFEIIKVKDGKQENFKFEISKYKDVIKKYLLYLEENKINNLKEI